MERYQTKALASLAGVTLAAMALVGCTEKGKVTNNDEPPSLTDAFCEVAASEEAKELLQISPDQISNETCLSDEESGVIGQYVISLNLEGPVHDTAEMTVTFVNEQSAQNSDAMLSFSELTANTPAADMRQVEIAGEPRGVVYASTGVAVSLGENILMVSIEESGSANPETGIITPTLDPSLGTELTAGNAPAAYVGAVAENLVGKN